MRAEELRVGNLFIWSELASMGQGYDFVTLKNITYHPFMNPVLITDELLEEFGFGKEDRDILSNVDQGIFIKKSGRAYFYYLGNQVEKSLIFMHELQNFHYALTGKELTKISVSK